MSKHKPVVFITRPIPQAGIDIIKKHAIVKLRKTDSVISRKELLAGVKQAEILLPILTDTIDAAVMDAAPKLQFIANYAAGFNNIDIPAATKRGITVTNTPEVLTDTTAELAVTLMLATARRIVESDTIMRAGKYHGWGPLSYLGMQVTGKTLAIIGFGNIGQRVAEMAHRGFDMNIIYVNPHAVPKLERSLHAKKVTLQQALKQADVVSLHVPLLPSTTHLLGAKEFKQMKRTAYLINASRGPVVDELALVRALKRGDIAGAGLDVYEREPKMTPGLKNLSNTVLVPHIGSASIETRTAMAELAANNIVAFIRGKKLLTPVN